MQPMSLQNIMQDRSAQDSLAREQALDCTQSWLVQAPAGSGKTSLLVERFIKLLCMCEAPEQVLAMTFTRAATAEMIFRTIEALDQDDDSDVIKAFKARDQKLGWDLKHNPQRLRIHTIDGFCLAVVRKDESRTLAHPIAGSDQNAYYIQAAEAVLAHLADSDSPWHEIVRSFLEFHSFSRFDARKHLIEMLARRDRWLLILEYDNHLKLLEDNWCSFLNAIGTSLKAVLREDVFADFAGVAKDRDYPYRYWSVIAQKLITKSGTWRKNLPCEIKRIIEQAEQADIHILNKLSLLLEVPDHAFGEDEQRNIKLMINVIKLACAELNGCFERETDYTQIHHAAIHTLKRNALNPLGSGRIRHILIDECQDLSLTQLELIKAQVRAFEDDHCTLFMVGDPMQSIYRFRQAEVGLFRMLRKGALSELALKNLSLRKNFRSISKLVEPLNLAFMQIAKEHQCQEDFEDSIAAGEDTTTQNHEPIQLFICEDQQAEAESACEAICALLKEKSGSIGVLAQGRNHMTALMELLEQRKIPYHAPGFQSAIKRAEVLELKALIKAMSDPFDALAWLCVLRAPFIGLGLEDLLRIQKIEHQGNFLDKLKTTLNKKALSYDGHIRLEAILPGLKEAFAQRHELPLREWLESSYHLLGGFDALDLEQRKNLPKIFDQIEQGHNLDTLYLDQGKSDSRLQLITIHSAKGLEFDHVFIMRINGAPKKRLDSPLMLNNWFDKGIYSPLISVRPKNSKNQKDSNGACRHHFLGEIEKEDTFKELIHLLYVACTRARLSLHLYGCATKRISEQSLLKPLENLSWVKEKLNQITIPQAPTKDEKSQSEPLLGRVKSVELKRERWQKPYNDPEYSDDFYAPLAYRQKQRVIGIVVHLLIQMRKLYHYRPSRVQILAHLTEQGLTSELDQAADTIEKALVNTFQGRHAHRLWNPKWQQVRCEWSLSGIVEGSYQKRIIDLSFIDDKQRRWIVDFKTTSLDSPDMPENFLLRQKNRFNSQIQGYAHFLRKLEPQRTILACLYFPLDDLRIAWLPQSNEGC